MARRQMYTPLGQDSNGHTNLLAAWWEVRTYELEFAPTINLIDLIGGHVNNVTFTVEHRQVIVAIAAPHESSWEKFEAKLVEYEANVLKALEVRKWANFAV